MAQRCLQMLTSPVIMDLSKKTIHDLTPLGAAHSAYLCFITHILTRICFLSLTAWAPCSLLTCPGTHVFICYGLCRSLAGKDFCICFAPPALNWSLLDVSILFLYIISGCICLSSILRCFGPYTCCSWFRSTSSKFSYIFSSSGP